MFVRRSGDARAGTKSVFREGPQSSGMRATEGRKARALTFFLRFVGRGGEDSTTASLRNSRRARCARFCGVGILCLCVSSWDAHTRSSGG
jgi:hypothetical protein